MTTKQDKVDEFIKNSKVSVEGDLGNSGARYQFSAIPVHAVRQFLANLRILQDDEVVVPREPTREQIRAGIFAYLDVSSKNADWMVDVYKAMLQTKQESE
jgi:hypothetical protein